MLRRNLRANLMAAAGVLLGARANLMAAAGVLLIAAAVGLLAAWPWALLVVGVALLIGATFGDLA